MPIVPRAKCLELLIHNAALDNSCTLIWTANSTKRQRRLRDAYTFPVFVRNPRCAVSSVI